MYVNTYAVFKKLIRSFLQYYPDKSACYECGETGHLSYKCNRNLLGDREPPPKKVRKRKQKDKQKSSEDIEYFDSSEDETKVEVKHDDDYEPDCETLSAAIAMEVYIIVLFSL